MVLSKLWGFPILKLHPLVVGLAVLPFQNLSGGKDVDVLADGLADEVIRMLTRMKGVRIVARTSSFQFRDGKTDLKTIGKKLNVPAALTGGVRKDCRSDYDHGPAN
jgi:TolB-like protein